MDQSFLTKTDPNLTLFSLLFLQELNLKNMVTTSPEILKQPSKNSANQG